MYSHQLVAVAATILAGHVTALPSGGTGNPAYKGGIPPGKQPAPYTPKPLNGDPFSLVNDYEHVISEVNTWTLFVQGVCGCTDSVTVCVKGDDCASGSQGGICGGQWFIADGGLGVGNAISYLSGDNGCSAGCNLAGGQPEDGLSCNPYSG